MKDESFDNFYDKMNDIVNIVNISFNLEEKMFNSKVVRNILRSLSEKIST